MPYRDVLFTLGFTVFLPFCFLRPWVGILMWSWLAYMNPHRYLWGFAHDFSFAQLVALATLAGLVFSSERKPFLWTRETVVLLALWGWFGVTTVFAFYPESAWEQMAKTSKILLMTVVVVPLFQDRAKFRALLMVIACSIGFFGFKGGIFSLATGGQYTVFGPPESFFSENNELAIALNMCLPILVYLAREETRRWLRGILWAAFGLSAVSVPFTYSRGGFLALVTVLAFLFLKARKRWIVLPLGAAALVGFMFFAPPQWFSRVQTLEDYEADESAQRRFLAWRIAYGIAADNPVTGGGFRVMTYRETYLMYVPEFSRAIGHDAHSIYFNLLAEHGWIGLGLFGLLVGFSMLSLMRLKRQAAKAPQIEWIGRYADMLYVSLIGYLVNGAFLSVAYFDLAYQLLILVPILRAFAAAEFAKVAGEAKEILPVPRPGRPLSHVS